MLGRVKDRKVIPELDHLHVLMFCTAIIPTVGRSLLKRAVCSLLDQKFDREAIEVIVVNDSGSPLPLEDWQQASFVRIVDTDHRERCVARNTGAALARGKYLYFLDDDDWSLPGALEVFWQLAQKHSEASWLYGGTMLYNRKGQPEIQLVHRLPQNCFAQVMAGEWIPLQASFIYSESFHKIGGFNPLIPGVEDMDLARRMALHFDFYGTDELVAGVGMGVMGSTTNQERARLVGQQAREIVLNEPGVYRRLLASADTSFWKGRIVRAYLTSAIWNLLRRRVFTTLSRVFYGLAALLSTFSSILSRDFWRAVVGPYKSEAFERGVAARKNTT